MPPIVEVSAAQQQLSDTESSDTESSVNEGILDDTIATIAGNNNAEVSLDGGRRHYDPLFSCCSAPIEREFTVRKQLLAGLNDGSHAGNNLECSTSASG